MQDRDDTAPATTNTNTPTTTTDNDDTTPDTDDTTPDTDDTTPGTNDNDDVIPATSPAALAPTTVPAAGANNTNTTSPTNTSGSFTPSTVLNGDREELGLASFVIPEGWEDEWTDENKTTLKYKPENLTQEDSYIWASRNALSERELGMSLNEIISSALRAYQADNFTDVVGPEEFNVDGMNGSRYIGSTNRNGKPMELYFAGIRVQNDIYAFYSFYDATISNQMRPAIETAMATFALENDVDMDDITPSPPLDIPSNDTMPMNTTNIPVPTNPTTPAPATL
jgi:hypothetical protein